MLALAQLACGGAVTVDEGAGGAGGAGAEPCADAVPLEHTLIMSVDERPTSPALAAAVLAWQDAAPGLQFRLRLNEPREEPTVLRTTGETRLADGVLHVNEDEPCLHARLVVLLGEVLEARGECAPALTVADALCFASAR